MKKNNFYEDVYAVVNLIPEGRVTSYGAIAKYLGTGLSARMVGWALNALKGSDSAVPAHRVVNRFGYLSGKEHFLESMQQLLESEGVLVENNEVKNFEKLFWDPGVYL